MEASFQHSMDGTEGIESRGNTTIPVQMANQNTVKSSDFLLRFFTGLTSLVAIIALATSKQTIILLSDIDLTPIYEEVTAKWQYLSAYVFFMAVNIIALVYAVVILVLSFVNRSGSNGLGLLLIILDLMIMALLFSANGAAASIGVIAYHGNSHIGWDKFCNVFTYNCRHVTASIVVSLIGSVVLFFIIILTILNLRKKSH